MNMNLKWIYTDDTTANCFFRSALNPPDLKVMLQITTRCNMHCKHCFLSATSAGIDLSPTQFRDQLIKKLIDSNVKKVTLTGGEPLLHPALLDFVAELDKVGIHSCICTNAALITEEMLKELEHLKVHFNVSLDGITLQSYGHFREISTPRKFSEVLDHIQLIGQYHLLNGILTTPNRYMKTEEYTEICDFAIKSGAKYLLLNPLSPFGRGKDANTLTVPQNEMNEIRKQLNSHLSELSINDQFQIVYIRFPNCDGKLTAPCTAGLVPYIFANGDIAVCPYMVFAAESESNKYVPSDFIVGNVFEDGSISEKLQVYKSTHCFCSYGQRENLGCAAMKIARNLPLDSDDKL